MNQNNMFNINNHYIHQEIEKIHNDEIFQNSQSSISINGYIASVLSFFIRTQSIKKILELGTLYGKSSILMANCDENIFVHSIENNEKNHSIAKQNIEIYGLQNRIQTHFGDAIEILNSPHFPKDFDMVFVDANKLAYIDYLHWCEKYLDQKAMLIFDNIFIHHALPKYNDKNCSMFKKMEEFLLYTANEKLFDRLILPYERDAICILKRK